MDDLNLEEGTHYSWDCCYCDHPDGPSGCASWCCNTESAPSAEAISAPGTGAMASNEVEARYGTTYSWLSKAMAHTYGASNVVSMDWATNDREQLLDVKEKTFRDTTSWLLSESRFRQWCQRDIRSINLFWLQGLPGSGKTVLSTSVFQNLLQPVPSKQFPPILGSTRLSSIHDRIFALLAIAVGCDAESKPDSTVNIGYGSDPHAVSIIGRGIWGYQDMILSPKFQLPGPSSGSYWTDWAYLWHRVTRFFRGHASTQRHWQFPEAARYRPLRHLHPRAIASNRSSWINRSERHQHKNILIPLVLVAYPSLASAAMPSMASEVFYQHVLLIGNSFGSETQDPFSMAPSTAQYFLVWGLFTCAAGGLLALQRSNPYLKHFGFLANGFLITVCVTAGTKAMLDVVPWTIMGTLLTSGLFYMFSHNIRDSADHSHLKLSNYARTCEDTRDARDVKILEMAD